MRGRMCRTCEPNIRGGRQRLCGVALVAASLIFLSLLATPGRAAVPGAGMTISIERALDVVVLGKAPIPPKKVVVPRPLICRSPFQPPKWVPGPPPWAPGKPGWVPGPPPWTRK
jgi:hypothetical protein